MDEEGKFFVIDGTDGSGKGTQTKLIIEKLKKDGYNVLEADFPRYGKKSAGLVEEYLNGKFGNFNEVSAYQASIFYAVDRFAASKKMKEHLKNGGIIISNRYVSANQIHQSSKIEDEKELNKFLDWLNDLEYNIFKIPRPQQIFFLNVPSEMGQELVKQKPSAERSYIKNDQKIDIHEKSKTHMMQAHKRAEKLAKKYNWQQIDCILENKLRTIEDINNEIYEKLQIELKKTNT